MVDARKSAFSARSVVSMAKANLDSWVHSPRTILMLIFAIAFCYLQGTGYARDLKAMGKTMHFGESMFWAINIGFHIGMTSILFLITVSELPRRISFQNYALIRSTRSRWFFSQILYCLWMVMSMLVVVCLFFALFVLPTVTSGSGWSETAQIAAGTIEPQDALISAYIREGYTPLTASLTALIPVFFFWFTMVMGILFSSLMGAPLVGVLFYAFLLIAHITIMVEAFPGGLPTPINFATLQNITVRYPNEEPTRILITILGYIVLNAVLIGMMYIRVRKVELVFYSENRL